VSLTEISQETSLPIRKAYGRTTHSRDYFFLEALDESMRKCKAKETAWMLTVLAISLLTMNKMKITITKKLHLI